MEPRSQHFEVQQERSVRLHALHWGDPDRPTLVALHGGGANAHWWDHLARSWSERFHVVALDFRGHGDSDHPETLRVGAFNDDLDALLEHLGKSDVFLVGHSMGAAVALDHAARSADTRGLVLVDVARGGARRSRRTTRLALLFRRTYPSRSEAIERYRFFPPAEHAGEALRLAIARHSVREEGEGRFGFKFDPRWFTLPPRERPDPSRVRCPVLLVRGAESSLLSREGAERWLEELPDARLVEIPDAGHHVQIDQPEAVERAVDAFLGELQDRRPD
ncbi:MAG: alpha/beta fold hydrolase [Myxococcota bacterium]